MESGNVQDAIGPCCQALESVALPALNILVEHISQGRSLKTDADASQLEGAVEDRSPFKPAEVLQLHAQQKPSTAAAAPLGANSGGASGVPEQDTYPAASASAAQSVRAVPEQEPKTGREANKTLAAGPVSRCVLMVTWLVMCTAWRLQDLKKHFQGFCYLPYLCYQSRATRFSASNARRNTLRFIGHLVGRQQRKRGSQQCHL